MKSVIAIVGRPNVGKSTLFNCLTRRQDALVADIPGVTRDRLYGQVHYDDHHFILVDTGGIVGGDDPVAILTEKQAQLAIKEADVILFMVDAKEGLHPVDIEIAKQLRVANKKVYLVVNKVDGIHEDLATTDFHALGFSQFMGIAASHRRGVKKLLAEICNDLPDDSDPGEDLPGIRVAVIGRPNVGKSTLINRIVGEERVMAHDMPGTTRDSVFVPFRRREQDYVLIDTAGVRRRARIKEVIEKFSVIKTLRAIEASHVVVMLVDATEVISEQDLKLLGLVLQAGKSLVIVVNKWDGLSEYQRELVKKELDRRLNFVPFAKCRFISALHGTGVGELFPLILKAYHSAMRELKTSELTELLELAVDQHQPPLVKGRRIKLRYANPGGKNPPTIVLHGNQLERLPMSYQRYLESFYRTHLKLEGTPVRLILRTGDNPFKEKE